MKNLKSIILIVISLVLLSNCQNVTDPVPEGNSMFPLNVGNYWVYESNVKSDLHHITFTYIDSMVITAVRQYEDYRIAEISFFNNGKPYDTNEIYVSSYLFYLKSQVLFPFMFLDQDVCMTRSPDTIKPLIHFDYPAYHYNCIFAGETFPSLENDSAGGYKIIDSRTQHEYIFDITKNNNFDFNFNNKKYLAGKWTINLEHLYSITYPDYAQFRSVPGCIYKNNYRLIIANTGWLELTLADGLGIAESKSVLNHCDSMLWTKTMKLIDFKLK